MGGHDQDVAEERTTICFPHVGTKDVIQMGDAGFLTATQVLYNTAESKALEGLISLKAKLRESTTDDFFTDLTEGMSRVLGADICFVMKRVLVDDQDSAVEMPPIGEPGSCLMAAALHYCSNDGTDARKSFKQTKFAAWGCPCAYMRHDKIFLIPDRLNEFITNNPNQLPYPCEAYIAVPLKAEGKCFAHFGAMWSKESAESKTLSWAVIELLMHSLEDMVLNRLLEGSNFVQPSTAPLDRARIIPHEAITAAQSLRPYAGSLSHELRTPMQGVVGMLDVMYATVQEAAEFQSDPKLQQIFSTLKENIEAVQDSSRRAVEAADNVVHAYDMDMSVPEGPVDLLDDTTDALTPVTTNTDKRPGILVAGSDLPIARPNKRRRDEASSRSVDVPNPRKMPKIIRSASTCNCAELGLEPESRLAGLDDTHALSTSATGHSEPQTASEGESFIHKVHGASRIIVPGLRHTNLKELVKHVINESLTVGGRPDSTLAQETELGETIEVRIRRSDGTIGRKFIEWTVDRNVPDTVFIDEMDLSKLISRVFLNAIKFTDNLSGRITLKARMSNRGRYISIRIGDNGPGIPLAFLPRLFKAFSQEDASLTRSTEGLGLGLMVAKGIARKLGGDLTCTRTDTEGVEHGTEFEIKVPLHAGETLSRPQSPFGSPLPKKAQLAKVDPIQLPTTIASTTPPTPYNWTKSLHEAGVGGLNAHSTTPPTPPSPRSLIDMDLSKPPKSTVSTTSQLLAAEVLPRARKPVSKPDFDRNLAKKYPLTFLVAEDNKINRKLLVSMLGKFGYKSVHEAHDGAEAVRQMSRSLAQGEQIDVVLMDLWMPLMDGYEATERILNMRLNAENRETPTVLAVTADVTDGALERAASVGMKGFMSKPYKLMDLQRLITEYCVSQTPLSGNAGLGPAAGMTDSMPVLAA